MPLTQSISINKKGQCYIGIDPLQIETEADERVHLAHELGHCVTGSFYSIYSKLDVREKHEVRADRWAIRQLMPVDEFIFVVTQKGITTPWEIAEYFGVTEDFVHKATDYYKLTNKQFRTQICA